MYDKANKQQRPKTRKSVTALFGLSSIFRFGAVPVTGSRGTVGSQLGRAGAMIPPWCRVRCGRDQLSLCVVMMGGRIGRRERKGDSITNSCKEANPSALPDGKGGL